MTKSILVLLFSFLVLPAFGRIKVELVRPSDGYVLAAEEVADASEATAWVSANRLKIANRYGFALASEIDVVTVDLVVEESSEVLLELKKASDGTLLYSNSSFKSMAQVNQWLLKNKQVILDRSGLTEGEINVIKTDVTAAKAALLAKRTAARDRLRALVPADISSLATAKTVLLDILLHLELNE